MAEIGKQCLEVDASLASLAERVGSLDEYASRLRYPGAPYQPTLEEVAAASALAREVMEAILSRLPEDVRP